MSQREFVDERYSAVVLTETQLHTEYRMSDAITEVTFNQWLENCMQRNNGTLLRLSNKKEGLL